MSAPLVIANCSGFYGDRLSAMREQLDGGHVDVICGDYLAELTMLILGRQKAKDAVGRLRPDLPAAAGGMPRSTRSSAGCGSSPTPVASIRPGLAGAVREVAARLGISVRVATVAGDDLLAPWDALAAEGRLVGGEAPPRDGRAGARRGSRSR